ncbi:MAG: hypothetical protein IPH54_19600 [Rhodoferax sp.]|nr:hypothetical protein [Rhodoferax sp.]
MTVTMRGLAEQHDADVFFLRLGGGFSQKFRWRYRDDPSYRRSTVSDELGIFAAKIRNQIDAFGDPFS